MLTDYHVHLRPDSDITSEYLTAENVADYRRQADASGVKELGVSEHIHRFSAALEIWDHPFWLNSAHDDVDQYCDYIKSQTDLKLGIEADFISGRESAIEDFLAPRSWDYVIGSVHFLLDRAVDVEGKWSIWQQQSLPDEVWQRYFDALAAAARSKLYDIIAHPDLVKIWGKQALLPTGDLRRFYEPVVQAFAESDVAVEISTAGLRKPVGEIYPAKEFLQLVAEAKLPVALSSDAHYPEQIGFGYQQALELLKEVGINKLAVFRDRKRTLVKIDD